MTPKQKARIGISYIEDAILEILETESEPLEPGEVSSRVGIDTCTDPDEKLWNAHAIVQSVLVKLLTEERVDRELEQRGKLEFRRWVRKGTSTDG